MGDKEREFDFDPSRIMNYKLGDLLKRLHEAEVIVSNPDEPKNIRDYYRGEAKTIYDAINLKEEQLLRREDLGKLTISIEEGK